MADDVLILRGPAPLTLLEIAARLRGPLERAGALRAIAFGSHARGEADAWSDLDLVVVCDTDRPFTERGLAFREVLDALPMGVDLLVYTPQEYRRLMAAGRGIAAVLAAEGREIYERTV